MPLPSVRTVGRAVDVWVAVLRSWRFSEGDQPRCTPGRPSAWRPASSSPCTAFATCPAAMLRVIAAVARSTRGLRGGGRGATDLIAASAYWISARDHFALIFPLLPVADVKAGFKVSGCLSLIEGSDRSLWPRCCRSICRHRRPLRSDCCRLHLGHEWVLSVRSSRWSKRCFNPASLLASGSDVQSKLGQATRATDSLPTTLTAFSVERRARL